jgi:hypothetical protein
VFAPAVLSFTYTKPARLECALATAGATTAAPDASNTAATVRGQFLGW